MDATREGDDRRVESTLTIEILEGPTDNPLRVRIDDGPSAYLLIESPRWRSVSGAIDLIRSVVALGDDTPANARRPDAPLSDTLTDTNTSRAYRPSAVAPPAPAAPTWDQDMTPAGHERRYLDLMTPEGRAKLAAPAADAPPFDADTRELREFELRAHVATLDARLAASERSFRCFSCRRVFATVTEAARHFIPDGTNWTPACILAAARE